MKVNMPEANMPEINIPATPRYHHSQKNYKPFATAEPKNFAGSNMGSLDYEVGDSVKHIKFGIGTVTNIVMGGKDYEVTVDFPRFGTKKLIASFAKLTRGD